MPSTIVLSAAQENSVSSICIRSKSRNTRLQDKEYFENLVRKLATRYVNRIQEYIWKFLDDLGQGSTRWIGYSAHIDSKFKKYGTAVHRVFWKSCPEANHSNAGRFLAKSSDNCINCRAVAEFQTVFSNSDLRKHSTIQFGFFYLY